MKNVPTNLSSLKSKVHKLDVDKLAPVPVDLSKLRDVVKGNIVKKMHLMLRSKMLKVKYLTNITNLVTSTTLNAKKMRVKVKYLVLLT